MLAGSLTFMGVWLWQSGLPAWVTPIYLFFAFVLFLGITRVVAEGGLAFIFAPMIASDFVAAGFGTRTIGSSGVMALALYIHMGQATFSPLSWPPAPMASNSPRRR